jgi:hypothetical protein
MIHDETVANVVKVSIDSFHVRLSPIKIISVAGIPGSMNKIPVRVLKEALIIDQSHKKKTPISSRSSFIVPEITV